MVENQQNNEVKLRTANQELLIVKLMKSRKLKDSEYRELRNILDSKVSTSYDASVFISYLLATVNFRRVFYNGNHKAYKRCFYCDSREKIVRYLNLENLSKAWVCDFCAVNLDTEKFVPVKMAESNDVKVELKEFNRDKELTSAQEDLICEHREQ